MFAQLIPSPLRPPIQEAAAALTAVAIVACGAGESPTPPVARPPFAIVSETAVTDSIQARLSPPLMVEVRTADGAPRAGVAVSFIAMPPTDTSRRAERAIVVAPRVTALFAGQVTDTTDAQGRAGVLVQLGTVAGSAAIAIRTSDGLTDTARFTVTAGNVVKLSMAFRDTTLMANESLDRIATVLDRFGNAPPIASTLTLTSLIDAPVTLTASGGAKATGNFGRIRIGVQGAGKSDSAFISVVPTATIAYFDNGVPGIFTARLNGTVVRSFIKHISEQHAIPTGIDWEPGGARFAMGGNQSGSYQALYVMDTSGTYRTIVPLSYEPLIGPGHYSADAQWIYYTKGYHSTINGQINRYDIFRIHPDGTGSERVYTPPANAIGYWSPIPMPDGRYLIVTGLDQSQQQWITGRFDLTTGALVQYGQYLNQAYCAASDLVAMTATDGRLWVVKSDGTGLHALPPMPGDGFNHGIYSPPAWSPDCAWIAAVNEKTGRLVVIRMSDGAIVPVSVGMAPFYPSWKP